MTTFVLTFLKQICVNDDLVAKRFAYYSTKSGDGLEEGDRLPVMLSYSILTQSVSNKPSAQTQPPPGKQIHELWLTALSTCWFDPCLICLQQIKHGSICCGGPSGNKGNKIPGGLHSCLTPPALNNWLLLYHHFCSYDDAAVPRFVLFQSSYCCRALSVGLMA